MYFKRLEIFGFKSFAEKTVLNFEPGVTAVVGPNGCGKSNVFDAIRWVLGEQSVRQLRGGEMQDVIFNGTDTKLALGFAEVSVTFDNVSRTLSVNSDEVVVTRRLFRSGESEYLINKEACRLKDVTELFMGTGVGAEAYSLVQQGRVDLVVSAKPDDRRMIFDEAAGITKYKSRKREAQGKLKETDDNLLRINDIVVEVKRQISSIERQAQKAQRYKEEFDKLKGLEQILAAFQMNELAKDKNAIRTFLSTIEGKETDAAKELDEHRQVVERESDLLEDLEAKVREVREQDLRIEGQMELANRQIGFDVERLQNLDQNEQRIAAQKIALAEKCRVHQEKLDDIQRSLDAFNQNEEMAVVALEEKKAVLAAATAAIQACQSAMRQDEEMSLQLASRQAELRQAATEVMKEQQGFLARRRRLDMEREKALAEKEAVDRRLAGVSQGIVEIVARRQNLTDELMHVKEELSGHQQALEAVNAVIDSLEKKKLFLISQKDFIEKLQVQYQDMPDPVIDGRFISSSEPVAGQSGLIGKIKEVIPVSADRLEALNTSLTRFETGSLYEIICETKFVELDPQAMFAQVESIETELKSCLQERTVQKDAVAVGARSLEKIQAAIHVEERRLSVSEAQQSDIGTEAAKIIRELEAVELEIADSDQGLARTRESEMRVSVETEDVEAEIAGVREGLKTREHELTLKRREREEAAVSQAQMESELQSLRDRGRTWRDNLDMYRSDLDGYSQEMERYNIEVLSYDDRRLRLRADIDKLNEDIAALRTTRDEARVNLGRFEAEEQDVSQRLSSVRSQITMLEKEIADNRDLVHEKSMKLQQIDFQVQSVRERIMQKYNLELSMMSDVDLSASSGVDVAEDQAQPVVDIDAVRTEIQALSKRCEMFGGVNLMAIEEFEELKTRFQFLTKQQSDLLTAKESLEQTIRKINKTTRQLFVDTFVKVNEQFRVYFRMLFNGGEAQLVLLDPENALESGIEIVARPPGKKLQTISLLSGGEKTMTAIALIFAVFRVNPSPFCVLDEIDAALDEANVDRFAKVLKEFAKIAQFIVITHNKKTIANADVMYGVTMQQSGVSRVVSVKFAAKEHSTNNSEPMATSDAVLENGEPEAALAAV